MGVTDRELALRAIDIEFQREVLDKLVRLETKMDALVGNGQPGRMKMAEDKVAVLERNDLRNSVHNRLVNGAISVVIRILRRALVASVVLPPYHAARKQQPITPALARSLSRKNATTLSNSQERPATPLMSSES